MLLCVHACEYSYIHSLLIFLKQKEISVRQRMLQTLKMMKHVMRCLEKKKNLILDFWISINRRQNGGYARAGKAAEKKAMGFLKASVFPTSISLLIHTLELGVHLHRRRVGYSRGGMVAIVVTCYPNPYPTPAVQLEYKVHSVFCSRVEFSFPLFQLRQNVQAWCMNQPSP